MAHLGIDGAEGVGQLGVGVEVLSARDRLSSRSIAQHHKLWDYRSHADRHDLPPPLTQTSESRSR